MIDGETVPNPTVPDAQIGENSLLIGLVAELREFGSLVKTRVGCHANEASAMESVCKR